MGPSDLIDVILTFKGHDGSQTRTLTAEIKEVKAGQTLTFKTRILRSKYTVKLTDEDPDISYKAR